MAIEHEATTDNELQEWFSGKKKKIVAISGNPTAWRVEPQGKPLKGEDRARYWNLRRWTTKEGKSGEVKRRRETKYIGSWEQAKEIYPTECADYQPRK
mgnify:CR=1 FL=1